MAERVLRDIRFALRVLARNPGFAILVVCAMGFGIAASTLLFSVLNATLLRPLPYRDADRLVMVWDQLPNLRMPEFPTSYGIFQDYRERNRSFERLEAFVPITSTLQFNDRAERVGAMRVTAGFLPMLGVATVAGRQFQTGEDRRGSDLFSLISHGLWMRRFGGSPSAVGQSILIDNRQYTIVGVLDPSFRFRLPGGIAPEVIVPVPLEPDEGRQRGSLRVIGVLRKGTSVEQATADMKTLAGRMGEEFHLYRGPRGEDAGYTVGVIPLRDQLFGQSSRSLLLLFASTLVLLAITCANVAHLFLEWRAKRENEFAVRRSMGASTGRLLAQLLIESLVVSMLGGAAGLFLVSLAIRVLFAQLPNELSALDGLPVDRNVFIFAAMLCGATGLLFGLIPNHTHRGGTRITREGLRPWLVALQTCLSVVLLVTAALLARSMMKLQGVDPGFRKEGIITGQMSLATAKYRDPKQGRQYWERVMEWSSRQPEFQSVALSSLPPLASGTGGDPFSIEGRAYQNNSATPQFARYQMVTPGYFALLRIPLLGGRFFQESDNKPENSVAIISQTLSQGFWPNENSIGKRITIGAAREGSRWMTIIGVVGDVKNSGLENRSLPQIYEPLMQSPVANATLIVGTTTPPEQMIARLEERMASFDRETPVYGISTLEQRVLRSMEQPRFRATLFSGFGLLAFLLAMFGIYSVTAFRVAQRTKEIGIRMAVGATPGDIRGWVSSHALKPVVIGLVAGIILSLAVGQLVSGFLYEVSPHDVLSYVFTAAAFVAVAWIASILPAQRAARQHPSSILRYE